MISVQKYFLKSVKILRNYVDMGHQIDDNIYIRSRER